MYPRIRYEKTTLEVDASYEGERIEQKVQRILNEKEPIKDGAPIIYTDRKDGVQPSFNIRTDRFEVAIDAMDKVHNSHLAKRAERAKVVDIKTGKEEEGNLGDTGGQEQNT